MAEIIADAVDYAQTRRRGRFFEAWRQSPGERPETTSGAQFFYPNDVTIWHSGMPETIPALTYAVVWGGSSTLFDLRNNRWISFTIVGSGLHYICTQQDWAAITAAHDAIGIEYHTRGGWRRYQPKAILALIRLFALLSGNANLTNLSNSAKTTDAPTDTSTHSFGTDGTPSLTYPEPDASNKAYDPSSSDPLYVRNYGFSPFDTGVGKNRLASNGSGPLLAISNDGTLWYLSSPTATAVQVSIAEPATFSGINAHYVLGVNYSPSTQRWWILYESVKQNVVSGTPDPSDVRNRGVFTMYYDESAHGALNPASSSNWAVDQTLQADSAIIPGIIQSTGYRPPDPGYNLNGTTQDGVMNGVVLRNSFHVMDASGGTINVTGPQFLEVTSLLVGAANAVVNFTVTCDPSGNLSINGTGIVICYVTFNASSGVIATQHPAIAGDLSNYPLLNPADTPDGPGSGLYWVFDSSSVAPTYVYTNWYIDGGTTFTLGTGSVALDGFDWPDTIHGGTHQFLTGSTGWLTESHNVTFPHTNGNPIRTDDLLATTFTWPLGYSDATYKYWTFFEIGLKAVSFFNNGTTFGYRSMDVSTTQTHYNPLDPLYPTNTSLNTNLGHWDDTAGTFNPPYDGGVGFLIGPGMTTADVFTHLENGQWFALGEDGSTVGWTDTGAPTNWQVFASSGATDITNQTLFAVDTTINNVGANPPVYKQVLMGPGTPSMLLDANGNVIDSAGKLDASNIVRAVCSDGSTGLYAIVGTDLLHRAGAFGTSWATALSGFSTETSILLFRFDGGTATLMEGTAGSVRWATWDGTTVTRGSYFSFNTDNLAAGVNFSGGFNHDFSAFSTAVIAQI